MKSLIHTGAICLLLFFLIADGSEVCAQTPGDQEYMVVNGSGGPQICIGRWVQSQDVAQPGSCEGQLVDMNQFAALSAGQSADRLSGILNILTAIDRKLAVNNDQVKELLKAAGNTRGTDEQHSRVNFLREQITKKFDELPGVMPANDQYKKQIADLKEAILKEVEKAYPER